MTIGEKIKAARKKRGWTLEQLSGAVGISISALSDYENDKPKGSMDLNLLCRIADALNDISILTFHCQGCPVRNMAFIKQFPDLNNIRRDPAVIAARLRKEMIEAADALDRLTERFSDADFKSRPDYMETFTREMEQVIDAKRCIEILEFELVLSGTHSSRDLKMVYERQQQKCIDHGHHRPEQDSAKAAA